MNAREDAYIHPGPLFHFRTSSHVSKSMKELSYLKVPQDPSCKDRQGHPTTIILCKSQSSQVAMGPKEHNMFMEETYSAGDHQPWDSSRAGDEVVRFQQTLSCSCTKNARDEGQRESTHPGTLGVSRILWT